MMIRSDELLATACFRGEVERVRDMLDHGAATNARGENMTSALHWAISMGHVEVAELLIKRGADVDARSSDGSTPLHVSAKEGDFETAEFLLEHGASPTLCNSSGQTPLQIALEFADDEVELIDLLRRATTKHERKLLEEKAAAAAKPRPKVQIVWEKDLIKAAAEGGTEGAAAEAMLRATTMANMSSQDASHFLFKRSSHEASATPSSTFACGTEDEQKGEQGTDAPSKAVGAPDISDAGSAASGDEAAAIAARRAKWGLDVDPRVFRAAQLAADPPARDFRAQPRTSTEEDTDVLNAAMAALGAGTEVGTGGSLGGQATSGAAPASVDGIDAALLSSLADKLMAWE